MSEVSRKIITPAIIANAVGFIRNPDKGRWENYEKRVKNGIFTLDFRKTEWDYQSWLRIGMAGKGYIWSTEVASFREPSYQEVLLKIKSSDWQKKGEKELQRIEEVYSRTKGSIQLHRTQIGLPDVMDEYDENGIIYFFDANQKTTNVVAIGARASGSVEVLYGRTKPKDGKIRTRNLRLITITPEGSSNFWSLERIEEGIKKLKSSAIFSR